MKLVKESIVLSSKGKKKLKESINDVKKDTTYLRSTRYFTLNSKNSPIEKEDDSLVSSIKIHLNVKGLKSVMKIGWSTTFSDSRGNDISIDDFADSGISTSLVDASVWIFDSLTEDRSLVYLDINRDLDLILIDDVPMHLLANNRLNREKLVQVLNAWFSKANLNEACSKDNKNCDNKVSGSFSEISKESPRALKKFIKAEKKTNGKLSPAAKEINKKLKKSSKFESLKESKLNEDFTENEIRDAVWQYCSDYSYVFTSEFYDLAKDILGRIDFDELNEDNIYDAVYDAMDESLIYTEDQWKMMELYQSPSEANFDNAWSDFESDLTGVVDILLKNKSVSDVE